MIAVLCIAGNIQRLDCSRVSPSCSCCCYALHHFIMSVYNSISSAAVGSFFSLIHLVHSGGFRGVRPHPPPLASFRKIQGLPILKMVRTADSTIIIITNFYLAASSHEIFLTVGGREGMKGLGALQRHQLPHPLAKILDPPLIAP